jgi:hypothetical protein
MARKRAPLDGLNTVRESAVDLARVVTSGSGPPTPGPELTRIREAAAISGAGERGRPDPLREGSDEFRRGERRPVGSEIQTLVFGT